MYKMKAEEYETQPAEDSKVNSFGLLMYFTYVLWPAKHLKGIVVEWHFGSWIPLFIYFFIFIFYFFANEKCCKINVHILTMHLIMHF